jgi:hypothetical protein
MYEDPLDFSLSSHTFRYWEIFLSWLFKYPSRCYIFDEKTKTTLKNPSKSLYQFGKSYRESSGSKGIICRVTYNKKDLETTCQILQKIYEDIKDPTLCDLATAEVLSKVLAYRDLVVGERIPIPTLGPDQTIHLSYYVVDKVFELWNRMRAFGLVRASYQKGAPILLYRGTEFSFTSEGGRASIISDLDPKGPGHSLFKNAKQHLHSWLKTITTEQGLARTIGHSLGGIIVAYTLLHETPFISDRSYETSYAFNFPGVSQDLMSAWEMLPEKQKPSYKGIICRGDVVSKFGKLFGDIIEVSLKHPLAPMQAHEKLLFLEPTCYLHQINLEEENQSASRQFYSKLHKQTSSMIYEFGLKFLFPN